MGADARGLLGGDGEEVDVVAVQRVLDDVEPARQQHFLDQAVELGDVLSISAFSVSRCAGDASASIDTAIFIRASGERSSWLALASSERCDRTSASMRAAATLKLAATAATSSAPEIATR